MARITRDLIQQRMDWYAKEYGFSENSGWDQIRKDLVAPKVGSCELPRAVAYGAYMALHDLLNF